MTMRSSDDSARLAELRSQTETILLEALGGSRRVAILDAPNQRNVGDSLIWAGELAYLKSLGCEIVHVSDLGGYDPRDVRRHLGRDGVVLLHGGGNFGDLWLGHQRLRERAVTDLPDYRIVQLPQSIYFGDEARAAAAHRILAAHPDLTVLIRDNLSMERARTQLPGIRTIFCPDMALGYEPAVGGHRAPGGRSVLVIARADREAASGLAAVTPDWLAPASLTKTDWWLDGDQPASWQRARRVATLHHHAVRPRRVVRRMTGGRLGLPTIPRSKFQGAIALINRENIRYAETLYARTDALVVDRLHAHVLAALMGIDHVLLDNTYRKLGAVFDDYTNQFSTARYCTDLDGARAQVLAFMDRR